MKQYNLTSLISSLERSLLSYMCSSLPIGNHATQLRLGAEFYKQWEKDTFKGPFLEAVPTYRTCTSLAEIFSSEEATSASDRRFREIVQPRYEAEDLHARLSLHGMGSQRIRAHLDSEDGLCKLWQRKLYQHQLKSLAHLLSSRGTSKKTGRVARTCFSLHVSGESERVPGYRRKPSDMAFVPTTPKHLLAKITEPAWSSLPREGVRPHVLIIRVECRFEQKYGGDAAGHPLHVADLFFAQGAAQ